MIARHSIAAAAATLCLLQACSTVAPSPQTKAMQVEPVLRLGHSGAASAVTYYQLGKFHQERNNLDVARASYLQSIALDPHQIDARNALAVIHAKQGRLDDAAKLLQELVRDYPKDAYLQNNLAYVHYLRHDYSAALGALERALRIEPGNARAHANLDLVQTALIEKKNSLAAGEAETPAQTSSKAADEVAAKPAAKQAAPAPQEDKAAALALAGAREAVLSPLTVDMHRKAPVLVPQALTGSSTATLEKPAYDLPASSLQVVQLQPNLIELRPNASVVAAARNAGSATEMPVLRNRADMTLASPVPVNVTAPAMSATTRQRPETRSFHVDIANGNGIGGMAAKMRKALEQRGIAVGHLSNRKPFDTAVTEIQYRAGYRHEAEHVRSVMQTAVTLAAVKDLPANADVRLLLGKDAGAHLAMLHGSSKLALNDRHK
jgi:tetratricopeptide (TPR) repeat protein